MTKREAPRALARGVRFHKFLAVLSSNSDIKGLTRGHLGTDTRLSRQGNGNLNTGTSSSISVHRSGHRSALNPGHRDNFISKISTARLRKGDSDSLSALLTGEGSLVTTHAVAVFVRSRHGSANGVSSPHGVQSYIRTRSVLGIRLTGVSSRRISLSAQPAKV